MSADSYQILRAVGPREAITNAVSILMVKHNVSRAAALEMLVPGSSGAQVKVRDIASLIVEEQSAEH